MKNLKDVMFSVLLVAITIASNYYNCSQESATLQIPKIQKIVVRTPTGCRMSLDVVVCPVGCYDFNKSPDDPINVHRSKITGMDCPKER